MTYSRILMLAALAQAVTLAAATAVPTPAAAANLKTATSENGETVEDRIANLHRELRITPDQEHKWSEVAKVMRENAADMQRLVDEQAENKGGLTAEDDLRNYQKLAETHVSGLRNLRHAFDSLYDSMPEDQKRTADEIFERSGRHHHEDEREDRYEGHHED
jgi:hypothetical protein